jgi:hypothetical protein
LAKRHPDRLVIASTLISITHSIRPANNCAAAAAAIVVVVVVEKTATCF